MVYLKHDYRGKGGNFYPRGEYPSLDVLPKEIRSNPDLISGQKYQVTVESLNIEKPVLINQTEIPSIRPIITKETIVEEPQVSINTASSETISALKGIGKVTAKRVVELREIAPFSDKKDLNDRVKLTGSRTWDSYNLNFTS